MFGELWDSFRLNGFSVAYREKMCPPCNRGRAFYLDIYTYMLFDTRQYVEGLTGSKFVYILVVN
jgi:hypothetical protein